MSVRLSLVFGGGVVVVKTIVFWFGRHGGARNGAAARPESEGTVAICTLMSRVSTCLSGNSIDIPTFKLTCNYLNLARNSNIEIINYILSCQSGSSILNDPTSLCHRCDCRVDVIILKRLLVETPVTECK